MKGSKSTERKKPLRSVLWWRSSCSVRDVLGQIIAAVILLQLGSDLAIAAAADLLKALPDGQLVLRGRVLLPDGSPAAQATVSSLDQWTRGETIAVTNAEGQFELIDDFGFDARIHVTSADGDYQTTWRLPAMWTRTTLVNRVEITLPPAIEHQVSVIDDDGPVAGAHVVAIGYGSNYRAGGLTGSEGTVTLKLPAQERLDRLSVWHPQRGISGMRFEQEELLPSSTQLELLPPTPHTMKCVSPSGNPVPSLSFGVSINTEATDYILTRSIEPARLRTGPDGTVTIVWFPPEFAYVDVDLFDKNWKVDEIQQADVENPVTTVKVRSKQPVEGRLIMPEDVSADGLLIQARSFGPGNRSDGPTARASADGTFSLPVCSDHVYFLTVVDSEWASDCWTGVILWTDDSQPADISLPVYPATPVEIHVTRGPSKRPVPNESLSLSGQQDVEWTDATGRERRGTSGMHTWVKTDANGIALVTLGKGFFETRISVGDWQERKLFEVTSDDPQTVEIHRPWDVERTVAGWLVVGNTPYAPTVETTIRAWGIDRANADVGRAEAVKPDIQPEGTFHVAFDAEEVCVFVHDRKQQLSGFARLGDDADEVTVIPLQKTGAFGGSLVDPEGQPLAGFEVTLRLQTTRTIRVPEAGGHSIGFLHGPEIFVAETKTTDAKGHFRFTNVPVEMPIELQVVETDGLARITSFPKKISLKPGEVRENVSVTVRDRSRLRE